MIEEGGSLKITGVWMTSRGQTHIDTKKKIGSMTSAVRANKDLLVYRGAGRSRRMELISRLISSNA
eukprot:7163818-Pyramimonas_sp.AAC.1